MHISHLGHAFLTASLVGCAAPSVAQSLLKIPSPPEVAIVRDMLQQDAQRALATEQGLDQARAGASMASAEADAAPTEASPGSALLELAGIYGMDGVLTAEIDINGSRHVLRPGQTHAVGVARDQAYRLVGIQLPCVTLRKPDDTLERLCHPQYQEM